MTEGEKQRILKLLKSNRTVLNAVVNEMNAERKINAIKELRLISNPALGLLESKNFIELYYTYNGNHPVVNTQKLLKDVGCKRPQKGIVTSLGIDMNQLNNDTLKDLAKSLKKEMKKRQLKF